MTMPWGATEEPDVIMTEQESVPVHVVSTDAKPGKSLAPEFGRWRTFRITSAIGNDMAVPGAVRIANRSLRRHRLHIIVNSPGGFGNSSQLGQGSVTDPGALATIASKSGIPPGTYTVTWSVTLSGTVTAADGNNMTINGVGFGVPVDAFYPGIAGTYPQEPFTVSYPGPALTTVTVATIAAASGVAAVYSAQFILTPVNTQPVTDGVIIGSREEIGALTAGNNPLTSFTPGGYLQIGDNVLWESQQELWAAYPPSNSLPVLVSTCDEQYASDPDAWREDAER